ncbi:hypothetical protein GF406_06970 [candidate division KSB1 bacterium]|nr:hypothetical protein [candidate division KSB1 bacterium]
MLSEYRTGSSHDGIDSVEYIYGVEGKLVQLDFDKGYTKTWKRKRQSKKRLTSI